MRGCLLLTIFHINQIFSVIKLSTTGLKCNGYFSEYQSKRKSLVKRNAEAEISGILVMKEGVSISIPFKRTNLYY